jgi:CelD/BcsL family acetyltransferase involved in cellulose biosynthesis
MKIFAIDPLSDGRWERFISRHPNASAFHTTGWLEALRRTYDYQPVAYTSAAPHQELEDGIVFCRVESWLTGRRLVSLPFSDHCQPLVSRLRASTELIASIVECVHREGWHYIEFRPNDPANCLQVDQTGVTPDKSYYLHLIDISPELDVILKKVHAKSVRHKLNRAARELSYESGNSKELLAKFYHLQVVTRNRHEIPPQPIQWFQNLMGCLGDKITIRVASKDGQPVASIFAIHWGNSVISKYGASDAQFHHLGGMPLLICKGIQEGKDRGARIYDLGRSDLDNEGLITFKNNWGAAPSILTYYRYSFKPGVSLNSSWHAAIAKRAFLRMPTSLRVTTSRFLYRHIA